MSSTAKTLTIVDLIRETADAQPDHPAVVASDEAGTSTMTYRDLVRRVDEVMRAMEGDWLEPYQRWGVKGENSPEFIIRALAVMDSNLCLVPIAEDYSRQALEKLIQRCRLHGILECNNGAVIHRFEGAGDVDNQGDVAFRQMEPAFIRFTSGTTNQRKGVVIGRQAVIDRVEAGNRGLAIGPQDRVLWLLPMAHHFLVSILLYLRHGATILLPPDGEADEIIEFANDQRATVVYASPDHYQQLLEAAGPSRVNFPDSVRLALSTSMGLSEVLASDFARTFGVHLTQALGIIEVGLPVVNLKHAVTKPLALGQVQPDYTVTLKTHDADEITRLGSDSGVGEVCIQGPGLFDAYLSPWIPASEILGDDGFRTGDLGYFDEDQDLYLLGRRQNRINIGGRKFFCEEVEAVLNSHEAIRESRVHSERLDGVSRVVADIVPANGSLPGAEALREFCFGKLNRYKVPTRFVEVQALEKTPTGKIRRW